METKNILRSKTLWTNIVVIVGAVLLDIGNVLNAGLPLTVVGVVNIVLRIITTQGVSFK